MSLDLQKGIYKDGFLTALKFFGYLSKNANKRIDKLSGFGDE